MRTHTWKQIYEDTHTDTNNHKQTRTQIYRNNCTNTQTQTYTHTPVSVPSDEASLLCSSGQWSEAWYAWTDPHVLCLFQQPPSFCPEINNRINSVPCQPETRKLRVSLAFHIFFCTPFSLEIIHPSFWKQLAYVTFQFPLPLVQSHSVWKAWPSVCCSFLCPNNDTAADDLGFLTCAQTLMHATACRGCTNTTREFALKVGSGITIPRRGGKFKLCQQCSGPGAQPCELHPPSPARYWPISTHSWRIGPHRRNLLKDHSISSNQSQTSPILLTESGEQKLILNKRAIIQYLPFTFKGKHCQWVSHNSKVIIFKKNWTGIPQWIYWIIIGVPKNPYQH